MEDPQFNRAYPAKYLAVVTDYNNRLFSDEQACKHLSETMSEFSIIHHGGNPPGGNYPVTSTSLMSLIYAKHSGYTWIEPEIAKGKIYPNSISAEDAQVIDQRLCAALNGLDGLDGAFVFDFADGFTVSVKTLIQDFLSEWLKPEGRFCGGFSLSNIMAIMYCQQTQMFLVTIDTESG